MDPIRYDPLAGMRPGWLVRPIVWLAGKMTGPIFIVEFVVFLILWILLNTLGPHFLEVDKWPFQGLNLFMSAIAGIQAAVIGVKQTIAEYKRDYEARRHDEKYDRIIEHIEQEEEEQARDAKRREHLQLRLIELLESWTKQDSYGGPGS